MFQKVKLTEGRQKIKRTIPNPKIANADGICFSCGKIIDQCAIKNTEFFICGKGKQSYILCKDCFHTGK